MTDDVLTTPATSTGRRSRRALWPTLAAWWAPHDHPAEPPLGYESAQPWSQPGDAETRDEDGRTAPPD